MRRDVLEIDTSVARPMREFQLSLEDAEAVRLVLGGGSVVDWLQLAFSTLSDVDRFLSLHLLDMYIPADRERLRYVYNEAVSYLEEHARLRFPPEVRHVDDVRNLFLWASQTEGFRRRQVLCCAILKLMHVIHHMEAADLKFKCPLSEEHLFELAEARILQFGRTMREAGLPIVSFYGSRKTRSSVITKLLVKKDTIASTIFDKLRFRVVVDSQSDLLPVLTYLERNLFPFNYVIPGQSHNNLLDPAEILRSLATIRFADPQEYDEPLVATTGKNEFSGANYRMINFITDFPVRLPNDVAMGPLGFELGRVVFVMIEFQLVDEQTARRNSAGENAHHLYKRRQRAVVERRLIRGAVPE